MRNPIRIKHQCESCDGTGLYVGMAERDGAAVVCSSCKGKGWQESVFQPFTVRKKKPGVRRVFQVNVGIVIGENEKVKLEDFGGMPIKNWLAGEPFGRGTEMRKYSCPKWWAQSTEHSSVKWKECDTFLGRMFSDCGFFKNKADCWERWDSEKGNKK